MAKFWPMLMTQKMTQDYKIAWCVGKETDKDQFLLDNWFIRDKFKDKKLPQNIPDLPVEFNGGISQLSVSFNLKRYHDAYGKDFDWYSVNYFVSDYVGTLGNVKYTYWFVSGIDPGRVKYDSEGNLVSIGYILTMDEHSTFYDLYMTKPGTVFIEQKHNERFVQDDIFGTGFLIPNIKDNEFIRYCQPYCQSINQKTQYYKTQALISDRNWDPLNTTWKNTLDTKFGDTKDPSTLQTNHKFVIYMWCQKTSDGKDPAIDVVSEVGKNLYIYKLFVYVPTSQDDFAGGYLAASKALQADYEIKSTTIGELCLTNLTQSSIDSHLYTSDKNSYGLIDEYFWLWDKQNILSSMIFYNKEDILKEENVSWKHEPHVFMNNHCTLNLSIFNKNSINIDISNFMVNKSEYNRMEYHPGVNAFKLFHRINYISPNYIDQHHILLDNDTSEVYKKNTGTLNLINQAQNAYTTYNNAYDQWMKTQTNQRQSGQDAIQKQYQIQQNKNTMTNIHNTGQAVSGWASSITDFATGNIAGGIKNLFGAAAGTADTIGQGILNDKNARLQEQASSEVFNAKYDDAKNQANNITTGGSTDGMRDQYFARDLDENNNAPFKKVYTPELSVMQIKEDRAQTIAYYINRWGYAQKNIEYVKHFRDLLVRKYWDNVKISNATDFFLDNSINPMYVSNLVNSMGNQKGITYINIENLSWDKIGRWELNNYEQSLESSLIKLQEEVKG